MKTRVKHSWEKEGRCDDEIRFKMCFYYKDEKSCKEVFNTMKERSNLPCFEDWDKSDTYSYQDARSHFSLKHNCDWDMPEPCHTWIKIKREKWEKLENGVIKWSSSIITIEAYTWDDRRRIPWNILPTNILDNSLTDSSTNPYIFPWFIWEDYKWTDLRKSLCLQC